MHQTLLNALNNRYATKVFNPQKKLSSQELETILESIRLTPTAFGLQLMKVVVVESPELRQELLEHSFNQKQVVEASHLLVLCRETEFSLEHINNYLNQICECRKQTLEELDGFKKMLLGYRKNLTSDQTINWMNHQVYIALGNLLTTCGLLGIDSCPMEGFLPQEYDKVLNLKQVGLTSVLVIPIGFASNNDPYKLNKKVRKPVIDFVITK